MSLEHAPLGGPDQDIATALTQLATSNAQEWKGQQQASWTKDIVAAFMTPGRDLSEMMMRMTVEGKNPRAKAVANLQWNQAFYLERYGEHSQLQGALKESTSLPFAGRVQSTAGLVNSMENGGAMTRTQAVLTGSPPSEGGGGALGWLRRKMKRQDRGGITQ